MKKTTKLLPLAAYLCANTAPAGAQKVKMEEIKEQCANLDYAKRVRLTVSSFAVSTPKSGE